MQLLHYIRRYRKALIIFSIMLTGLILFTTVFVRIYVEPTLRKRFHTLIIQGSDSLYRYTLGDLHANFFGGSVEVENLHIWVDSSRYEVLKSRNKLPPLTFQLDLERGSLEDIAILPLIFGKKVQIREIISREANIRLSKHLRPDKKNENTVPLWKLIQPNISSIQVDRISLNGVKLLYRHADTSRSIKIQFDRCEGYFRDIRIDSASSVDPERFGFARHMKLKFDDLKFRSQDSSFKLKAELISYSSEGKLLEIDSFKLQPTREEPEDFYAFEGVQTSMEVYQFKKLRILNFDLRRFILDDFFFADSIDVENPIASLYIDRNYPRVYKNKIGRYPHQLVLNSKAPISIRALAVRGGEFLYTEVAEVTRRKGMLSMAGLNVNIHNLTNIRNSIRQNPLCTLEAEGKAFNTSPVNLNLRFFLDSTEGQFRGNGTIRNVNAGQLGALSSSLSNTDLQSFDLHRLDFQVRGDDFTVLTDVKMRYDNLFLVMKKTDRETGVVSTSRFMTRVVNKYVYWPSNPGPDGVERTAVGVKVARTTGQSFFGLLWKAVFAGMQEVMSK